MEYLTYPAMVGAGDLRALLRVVSHSGSRRRLDAVRSDDVSFEAVEGRD